MFVRTEDDPAARVRLDEALQEALQTPLLGTDFSNLGERYVGKVRDTYASGDRLVLITSDRISAFDRVLGTLPLKGEVLGELSRWWFEETKHVAPNHVIDAPDRNVLIGHRCEPLPVEMVMRAHLTGVTSTSIWHHYEKGERSFCGHALPDGLRKHQALEAPLLTPSTKAKKGDHDVSVTREDILAMGQISARDFDEAAAYARALFEHGRAHCAAHGLMLVDTKYEFGRAPNGRIVVMDEIHTPDSSRYWIAASYEARMAAGEDPESLDKEYVRRWLKEQGYAGDGPPPVLPDDLRVEASRRYIDACERVRGARFTPAQGAPLERVNAAVEPYRQQPAP
ncbi:MAG: phosphoribosylaminoimidazolesuccinocarboxamide synthase [Myxococcota bacterium]